MCCCCCEEACFYTIKCRDHDRCGSHEGARTWLSLDSCGMVCAIATWLLLAFGWYGVVVLGVNGWMLADDRLTILGKFHVFAFTTLIVLAYWSHLKAMLTDPGSVPKSASPLVLQQTPRTCKKCHAYKPASAHHCSICGRCVVRMDHHCPWVNNCVAGKNLKFFVLFCSYTCAVSVYAMCLLVSRVYQCSSSKRNRHLLPKTCLENVSTPLATVLLAFVVVESLLFGLFTLCMICDQYSTLSTGATQIDRLKNKDDAVDNRVSKLENFKLVFGDDTATYEWFLPTSPRWKNEAKILGYTLAEGEAAADLV